MHIQLDKIQGVGSSIKITRYIFVQCLYQYFIIPTPLFYPPFDLPVKFKFKYSLI